MSFAGWCGKVLGCASHVVLIHKSYIAGDSSHATGGIAHRTHLLSGMQPPSSSCGRERPHSKLPGGNHRATFAVGETPAKGVTSRPVPITGDLGIWFW